MNDVDGGYTRDTNYTYGYFPYLAPSWLELAAVDCGVPFPCRRPLRYLELGYGNGISLNIHAAAHPGEYWGTDFNPEHAKFAQELSDDAGTDVNVLGLPFSELLNHPELPEFDIITAHGIWSWISDQNRAAIVEIVQRKLADGGLFYVSYNALPGCSPYIPLQRLLRLQTDRTEPLNDNYSKLRSALAFANDLAGASSNNGYFSRNPRAAERLKSLEAKNATYLIHEYLGEHWHPVSVLEVAEMLSAAGLEFLGSANFGERHAEWGIEDAGRKLLASINEPLLRETARDYLINREFRRDIFVKGKAKMTVAQRRHRLENVAFAVLRPADEIEIESSGYGQEIVRYPELCSAILGIYAGTGAFSLKASDITSKFEERLDIEDVIASILSLTEIGAIYPVQHEIAPGSQLTCNRLNARLRRASREGNNLRALASPITGHGVKISHWHCAFEDAHAAGAVTPAQLLQHVKNGHMTNSGQPEFSEHVSAQGTAAKLLREAVLFLRFQPGFRKLGL